MIRRALLLALLALLLVSCASCESVLGTPNEIARVLKSLEAANAAAPMQVAGCGEINIKRVSFDRILVKPEGDGFVALATVDAEAVFNGTTAVSYLGLERIPFARRNNRWAPKDALLPVLQKTVHALCSRLDALNQRNLPALGALVAQRWTDPRLSRESALKQIEQRLLSQPASSNRQAVRWLVRSEREGVEVLEEYEDKASEQPTRRGQTRFQLHLEQGKLYFVSGLI